MQKEPSAYERVFLAAAIAGIVGLPLAGIALLLQWQELRDNEDQFITVFERLHKQDLQIVEQRHNMVNWSEFDDLRSEVIMLAAVYNSMQGESIKTPECTGIVDSLSETILETSQKEVVQVSELSTIRAETSRLRVCLQSSEEDMYTQLMASYQLGSIENQTCVKDWMKLCSIDRVDIDYTVQLDEVGDLKNVVVDSAIADITNRVSQVAIIIFNDCIACEPECGRTIDDTIATHNVTLTFYK